MQSPRQRTLVVTSLSPLTGNEYLEIIPCILVGALADAHHQKV